MDFVINFLITELKNNIIMVVVDWLFKMAHFILLYFDTGKADTIIIIKFLFDYIFKLYNLLKEIILNRNSRFTFNIARQLYYYIRINQFIFTITHPETNG